MLTGFNLVLLIAAAALLVLLLVARRRGASGAAGTRAAAAKERTPRAARPAKTPRAKAGRERGDGRWRGRRRNRGATPPVPQEPLPLAAPGDDAATAVTGEGEPAPHDAPPEPFAGDQADLPPVVGGPGDPGEYEPVAAFSADEAGYEPAETAYDPGDTGYDPAEAGYDDAFADAGYPGDPAGDGPAADDAFAFATGADDEPDWDAIRAEMRGESGTLATAETAATVATPPPVEEETPAGWADDIITDPGWPLPGDVDESWDTDGGFGTTAEHAGIGTPDLADADADDPPAAAGDGDWLAGIADEPAAETWGAPGADAGHEPPAEWSLEDGAVWAEPADPAGDEGPPAAFGAGPDTETAGAVLDGGPDGTAPFVTIGGDAEDTVPFAVIADGADDPDPLAEAPAEIPAAWAETLSWEPPAEVWGAPGDVAGGPAGDDPADAAAAPYSGDAGQEAPESAGDGDTGLGWTDPAQPEAVPAGPAEEVAWQTAATVEAPAAPEADARAWWDDEPEPEPVPAPASVAVIDVDESRTGHFAIGGMAFAAGHEALAQVAFRQPMAPAPQGWTTADAPGAPRPGTIVLTVEATLNCRPDQLSVVTDPGFAPNEDGFTLRLAALANGPFAASGTFAVTPD